jgi:hypothetical protein
MISFGAQRKVVSKTAIDRLCGTGFAVVWC